MLTSQQVANELDAAYSTVMLWIKQGRFPGAELVEESRGPVWYIPASALEKFERPKPGRPRKPKAKKGGQKKPYAN